MAAKRYLLADFSNNNGFVQLPRVRDAGVVGFWHKVSEGQEFTDRDWHSRATQGRINNLRVGGYHFARFTSLTDAQREATHFVRMLGKIRRRDLAPVLDLEVTDGVPPATLLLYARRFMHVVHELTGVWPLFYSYPDFIKQLHAEKVIGRGLWLASYERNDGKEHKYVVPAPFKKALAHQFTSNARLSGVSGTCDLSSAPRLYPLLARGLRGL